MAQMQREKKQRRQMRSYVLFTIDPHQDHDSKIIQKFWNYLKVKYEGNMKVLSLIRGLSHKEWKSLKQLKNNQTNG